MVNSLTSGGAEKVALTLLMEMKATGYDVVLICLEREQLYEISPEVEVIYLTKNKKIQNPLFKIPWIFISAYRLSTYIHKKNIRLVQSHLVRSNLINTAAKLFGAKHKAQVVTHSSSELEGHAVIKWSKIFFYGWLYRKADQVISISETMKKIMDHSLSLQTDLASHVVINNPHDILHIQQMSKEIVTDFDFNPKVKYIISVGRLQHFKRVDLVIEALASVRLRIPNVELIILGEGEHQPIFENKANELHLTEYVHFLGYKSNPYSILSNSDVLILSSQNEGLPNIIIEALACGVPVISTDCVTGPREILSPQSNFDLILKDKLEFAQYGILYPVDRTDLLIQAILKLLSSDELRNQYIGEGIKYVRKYDKKIITKKYLSKFINEQM